MSFDKTNHVYGYGTKVFDLCSNIVDEENKRIDTLKDVVDEKYDTFERKKDLKVSSTKRLQAWQWIYMVALAAGIISLICILLRFMYPNIWGIDTVLVIVLGGFLSYLFYLYLDIQHRSPTDFDKVNSNSFLMSQVEVTNTTKKYGVTEVEECEGKDCCTGQTANGTAHYKSSDAICEKFQGARLQESFYGSIDQFHLENVGNCAC
jgi:hypothetical protein